MAERIVTIDAAMARGLAHNKEAVAALPAIGALARIDFNGCRTCSAKAQRTRDEVQRVLTAIATASDTTIAKLKKVLGADVVRVWVTGPKGKPLARDRR